MILLISFTECYQRLIDLKRKIMSRNDYWIKFWKDYSKKAINKHDQLQVLRTKNKAPIDDDSWKEILQFVLSYMKLEKDDEILDLFGGNGLFAKEMSTRCKSVTVIDISKELLDNIDTKKYKNITRIAEDVRKITLPKNHYSKALIYAGIQYLTKRDTIELFKMLFNYLREGGICYIGDIPDTNRIWNFFNNEEREALFFESILENKPIIGTWFDNVWLEKLAYYIGFSEATTIRQKKEMIYSYFRFDLLIKR